METVRFADKAPMLDIEQVVAVMKERHAVLIRTLEGFVPPPTISPSSLTSPPPPHNSSPNPQARVDAVSALRETHQPVVIAAQREIPMDLVVTSDYTTACKIKDVIVKQPGMSFYRQMKLAARALDILHFCITWSDLHQNEDDPYSTLLVSFGDLIECGLSFSDLRSLGLATSYQQIKSVLNFTPVDLCVSYRRFNLSHLMQYQGFGYNNLLFDFKLGMVDYFVKLNLSLDNIASLGINIEIAMNWRAHVEKAYADAGMVLPTLSGKSNSRISGCMLPLDREMLQQRYEKRISTADDEEYSDSIAKFGSPSLSLASTSQKSKFDLPKNWFLYMGLQVSHLRTMKVTYKDLEQWWLKPYNLTLDTLLLNVFECTDEKLIKYYKKAQMTSTPPPRHSNKDRKPSKTRGRSVHHPKQVKTLTQSSSTDDSDSDSSSSSASFDLHDIGAGLSATHGDDERHRNDRSTPSSSSSSRKTNKRYWQQDIPDVLDKF